MRRSSLHPFPARMAPEIATRVLDDVESSSLPLKVLDPMCGSGTVLAAAVMAGHSALGFDMDPLAVRMSRVLVTPVDEEAIRTAAADVVAATRRSRVRFAPWHDSETRKFVEFWFGEDQRVALARLAGQISVVPQPNVRRALEIALSRLIVTKAPRASLAADTSHSRPHRVIETSSYDVVKGFEESVRHVQRTLSLREHTGAAAVELGDARGLPLEDCSIDLTITSPPYLNAIDYMRGHKLALVWLGHTLSELRSIRSTTIGAERRQAGDLDHRTADLLKPVMAGAANPSGLPIRTLERYAHDLAAFSEELFRVMRPGAKVVAVIGNSSVKGNYIKNDAVLALALEAAGFTITGRVERALPAGHRYLPSVERTANEALGKRMNSEIILTASRS